MNEQQKNIKKTLFILVAVMVTILVLFLNKITTPRYLSNIELKINGLVLIKESKAIIGMEHTQPDALWRIIVKDKDDVLFFSDVYQSLKTSVRENVAVVDSANVTSLIYSQLSGIPENTKIIPILNPSGELIGYFKKPFDKNKAILTLSSIVTHR